MAKNKRNRTAHVTKYDLLVQRCFVSTDTTGITAGIVASSAYAPANYPPDTWNVVDSLHTFTLRVKSTNEEY